jgi:hypothetical protein
MTSENKASVFMKPLRSRLESPILYYGLTKGDSKSEQHRELTCTTRSQFR